MMVEVLTKDVGDVKDKRVDKKDYIDDLESRNEIYIKRGLKI